MGTTHHQEDSMDMKDFINRAKFRKAESGIGIIANFDGKDYAIAPFGAHQVSVIDPETANELGRLRMRNGSFVPA